MDETVLYKLSYGLYVVGVYDGIRPVGCVVNTCFQITSNIPRVAVSVNKNNFTMEAVRRARKFSLSIISEETPTQVIGTFGFRSSGDGFDKYAGFGYGDLSGTPIVNGSFSGRMVCEVEQIVDCDTHCVVISRVVDTMQGEGHPMTYEYYHNVVKGKAPKNAPTYREEKPGTDAGVRRWRCDVCGYVAEADELPDDFVCPVCKMPRSHFYEVKD